MVVIALPIAQDGPQMGKGSEPMGAETFVSKAPVEALGEGVLRGFSGLDELDIDSVLGGPFAENATAKLRAVVARDGLGIAARSGTFVEHAYDIERSQRYASSKHQAAMRGLVLRRKDAHASAIAK